MTTDTILRNARIVLPDEVIHGSVRMIDGVIVDVMRSDAATDERLDAGVGAGDDMGGD